MEPRSTSRSISEPGLVVGLIKAPHGVHGEVRVDPRGDVPERFSKGAVLDCDGMGPLTIAAVRGTEAEPIVRFTGFDTRPDAEPLRGRFLRVSRDAARKATAGSYLWADLVGLRAVSPSGDPIGAVRDVLRAGETDVLVVARPDGPELLVPAIASVVREVDLPGGRIVLVPQEDL